MAVDLDLYEFNETICELDDKEIEKLKLCEDKGVVILEVGKNSREIDNKLRSLGFKSGDRVLGVVQG